VRTSAGPKPTSLIVSNALPKGVHTFDPVDGVWVTETRCALPVAMALRESLIEIAAAPLKRLAPVSTRLPS